MCYCPEQLGLRRTALASTLVQVYFHAPGIRQERFGGLHRVPLDTMACAPNACRGAKWMRMRCMCVRVCVGGLLACRSA